MMVRKIVYLKTRTENKYKTLRKTRKELTDSRIEDINHKIMLITLNQRWVNPRQTDLRLQPVNVIKHKNTIS